MHRKRLQEAARFGRDQDREKSVRKERGIRTIMKIIGKQPSREKCAESGWFAWDYLLDEPIEREFILKLRPLGGFTYLDMLKQPDGA